MPSTGLTFYKIKIQYRQNEYSHVTKVNFEENVNETILTLFKKEIQNNKKWVSANNKLLSFDCVTINNDFISGLVSEGNFTQKQTNVNSSIDSNFIILTSFYFLIKFKKFDDYGLLVLERQGNTGIKSIFMEYLKNLDKNLQFFTEIAPPSKLLEKYIHEGNVKSLVFHKKEMKNEPLLNKVNTEASVKLELIIKNAEISPLNILNLFDNKFIFKDEFYDDLVIKVELGGRIKSIHANDVEKFSSYFDITDDLNFFYEDRDKFLLFDKIAKDISNIYYKNLL